MLQPNLIDNMINVVLHISLKKTIPLRRLPICLTAIGAVGISLSVHAPIAPQ